MFDWQGTQTFSRWNAKSQIRSLMCTLRNSNIAITSLVCTLRNSKCAFRIKIQNTLCRRVKTVKVFWTARDFLYRRMVSEARGNLFVKATCLENSDQSLTLFLTE